MRVSNCICFPLQYLTLRRRCECSDGSDSRLLRILLALPGSFKTMGEAVESHLGEAFKKKFKGTGVCLLCGRLCRFPSGTTHKCSSKHDMREMTLQERAEEIQWYTAMQGDGEAARLKILDQTWALKRWSAQALAASLPSILASAVGRLGLLFGGRSQGICITWSARRVSLHIVLILKRAKEPTGIMEEALRLAGTMGGRVRIRWSHRQEPKRRTECSCTRRLPRCAQYSLKTRRVSWQEFQSLGRQRQCRKVVLGGVGSRASNGVCSILVCSIFGCMV